MIFEKMDIPNLDESIDYIIYVYFEIGDSWRRGYKCGEITCYKNYNVDFASTEEETVFSSEELLEISQKMNDLKNGW